MRLQPLFGHRPARATAARRRCRLPRIERLEGRAVPASYTAASVTELVAAVNAANLTAGADTITRAVGKTFTLAAVNNTADGPTGLPVVAAGEDLTVVGNGAVIERSTATGTPAFRLLDVATGGALGLQNLTLQGGLALGLTASGTTPAWSQGGAVYNRGTLALGGVIVQDNIAQGSEGGQVWGSAIPGGTAAGGGIYSGGAVTLEGSTLRGNLAVGGRGAPGGFIAADFGIGYPGGPGGDGVGGGLCVGGGTVVITNSAMTANTARGGDGGDGAGLPKGVDNLNPTAGGDGGDGSGGAIYAAAGSVAVRNTEITSSLAQGGAGGAGGAQGGRHAPDGANGLGVGGALYIVNPDASVILDDFTLKHFRRNKASTSDGNTYGSYTRIP